MSRSSRQPSAGLRTLFSASIAVQGLVLIATGLLVHSVNLPFAPQRLDRHVFIALGVLVILIGIASFKLPTRAALAVASPLMVMMIVFAAGYHRLARGDLVLTIADGRLSYRTYESETEWADRYGLTDLRLGRRGIPNAVARHVTRDFSVTYRLDDEGWRRLPAPAGNARGEIWFLGCSYTFGVGVEDDEVYVHRLAGSWPRIQLRNFSVPAWGTTNVYLALEDQLSRRPAPRAVVYGWIDEHRIRNYLRRSWFGRTHAALVPHFEVEGDHVRWVGMEPNGAASVEDGQALDATEASLSEALIRGMARLAKDHGAPFVLLVLQGGKAIRLDAFGGESGMRVLNVSQVSDDYFPHDGHPTKRWHQTVARAIASDPLLAEVTGISELQMPDAIPQLR